MWWVLDWLMATWYNDKGIRHTSHFMLGNQARSVIITQSKAGEVDLKAKLIVLYSHKAFFITFCALMT